MISDFKNRLITRSVLIASTLLVTNCFDAAAIESLLYKSTSSESKTKDLTKTKHYDQRSNNSSGLLKEIIHLDESGIVKQVDLYLNDNSIRDSNHYIKSISYDYKKRKQSITKFYSKKYQLETGVIKSIFHIRPDGSKQKVTLFYNMQYSRKGYYKIIYYYDSKGNELKHEGYFTPKKSKLFGYHKAVYYLNSAGEIIKKRWIMTPQYVKKEKVTKVIFYFDTRGNQIKQEGEFTNEQANKQGFYKIVMFFDDDQNRYKEERFYTKGNLIEKGFIKGTAYFGPSMDMIKQERLDRYGNTIIINNQLRWPGSYKQK